MKINRIYTNRDHERWPSWFIVHEWEDVFSETLNIPMLAKPKGKIKYFFLIKDLCKGLLTFNGGFHLSFFMAVSEILPFCTNRKNIPIIIDFWKDDFKRFNRISKCFKVIYVTNLEIYNELLSAGYKNIKYMPLSIPDKYKIAHECVDEKDIDIIQIGRKNEVINAYMERLLSKYPSINYIRQELINSKLHYISSKSGDLGSFHTREEYMSLIKRCKISLLSSPGLDNYERTGGYNPVTPRFYESAVNYCYMLGRFPDNADFQYCGISTICESIDDYNAFEDSILSKLNRKFDQFDQYDKFLEEHFTSKRVRQLINELNVK